MEKTKQNSGRQWQHIIWIGMGICLFSVAICLFWLTIANLSTANEIIANPPAADLGFVFSGLTLVILTLLRLLAILTGAAIAFAGLAVSFFAHDKAIKINLAAETPTTGNAKATLATYSPGIIGVLAGTLIIITAIAFKSTHTYNPASTGIENTPITLPPLNTK